MKHLLDVRTVIFFVLGVTAGLAGAAAQKAPEPKPQAGTKPQVRFLVAQPGMMDPLFQESVVLMLPASEAPVGLIVNKPTGIGLRAIFPDSEALKKKDEPAYFGGPVDLTSASFVFRSPQASPHAVRIAGDIYISFDAKFVEDAFNTAHLNTNHRLFLGRAQWLPGQLQNEMRRGDWYSIQAEGDLIFSPDSTRAWHTLLRRAEPYTMVQLPALIRSSFILRMEQH